MSAAEPHVVVVGGGLAGLGAALDLADAGARVTLLERRRRLGGLTWSYEHHGRWVDNGQHVFLRCCRAYLGFLDRIGSAGDVELQPRLDLAVLREDPAGGPAQVGRLRRSGLPAPLHLGTALLRYPHLATSDKARLGLAVLPLRRLDLDDPRLDEETFATWLRRHGQSEAAIAGLWDLITLPTVNLPAGEASAAMGAKVFRTGLLDEAAAADVGWARIPLGTLHGERAGAALAKAGAEVRLDARVTAVEVAGAGVRVATADGPLDADAAVVAVPHQEVAALLDPGAAAALGPVADLGASPIVDVHLTYAARVTDLPLFAALGSPAQWVFDRTASSGMAPGDGQYLAVSLSAADEAQATRPGELVDRLDAALGRLLPAARRTEVVDSFVTKERTATFRAAPGSGRLRARAGTAAPGVHLAGAWTDTGWPATMEGALRSGRRAARAALIGTGTTRSLPQEVA